MELLLLFTVIGIILKKLHLVAGWSIEHKLVASANQTAYLLESDGTYRILPSNPTRKILKGALEFGFDKVVPTVSDEELPKYAPSPLRNPDLAVTSNTPDEVLRVFCQEIEYLEYPWYIKRKILLGPLMNPSIVRWQGKALLIYRVNYMLKRVALAWMKPDMSGIDWGVTYLGIKSGALIADDGHQEDPRGYVLHDNRLLITYGQTTETSSKIKYILGTVYNGRVSFNTSVELKHSEIWQQYHKNWVPFEYEDRVYFYKYLNPPDIVTMKNQFSMNGKVRTAYGISTNDTELHHKTHLPWRGHLYGTHLRGGTPALLVRGMLLSFFHTHTAVMKAQNSRETYFMGVVAMCPHPPFNIIKTSKVPVMDYAKFYNGPWVFPRIDYVVFPSGIMLSEDEQYLWVSMGHQDKFGFLLQFEVDGLLKSLYHHRDCEENTAEVSEIIRDGF